MAPAKTAPKSNDAEANTKSGENQLLYSVLAHIRGEIDFKQVAADIGVPNAEAARKRLKRFLTKEGIEATVKGSQLGGGAEEQSDQTSKATPKKSAKGVRGGKKDGGENGEKVEGVKTTGAKRKAEEISTETNGQTGAEDEPGTENPSDTTRE